MLWPVEQLSAWPHQLPCAVSQTLPAPVQRHAFWLCRSFASLDHSQPSCLCTVERISVRSVVPKKKTIGGLYGREACCDFRSWSWLVLGLSWIRSTEVLLGNHQSRIVDWTRDWTRSRILARFIRRQSPHLGVRYKATPVASHSFGNGSFRATSRAITRATI